MEEGASTATKPLPDLLLPKELIRTHYPVTEDGYSGGPIDHAPAGWSSSRFLCRCVSREEEGTAYTQRAQLQL